MRTRMVVVATAALMVTVNAEAKNSTAEWCEKQWAIESGKTAADGPRDYGRLLRRWQEHGPKCVGTVVYEARLATAYLFHGQADKAKEVLSSLGGRRSEYDYLVAFAGLQVSYFAAWNGDTANADVPDLEKRFLDFVRKYPQVPDGHAMLGGIQTVLGKCSDAIKSLELGMKSQMDVSGVLRNLTICYVAKERYSDAMRAADEAYRLNKEVTSDQYFIYAIAKADAALGDLKAAETALRLIAAKKPEVRRDPEFKLAVDFVTSRMAPSEGAR